MKQCNFTGDDGWFRNRPSYYVFIYATRRNRLRASHFRLTLWLWNWIILVTVGSPNNNFLQDFLAVICHKWKHTSGAFCVQSSAITHNVCVCVSTVSSGYSQQTGSEWRQPWKTATSPVAEWDSPSKRRCSSFSLNLLLQYLCPAISVAAPLSLLQPYIRAPPLSSFSIPLKQQLIAPLICLVCLFSGCLRELPFCLSCNKQIDPPGAIAMTKAVCSSPLPPEPAPSRIRCKQAADNLQQQQTLGTCCTSEHALYCMLMNSNTQRQKNTQINIKRDKYILQPQNKLHAQ